MAVHVSVKRRQHRGIASSDNVKAFAAACLLVFVLGNLVMLQSYHALVTYATDKSTGVQSGNSIVFPHGQSGRQKSRDVVDSFSLNNKELFYTFAADFLPIDRSSVGGIRDNQYSALEARARRLMEDVNTRDRIYKMIKNSEIIIDLHKPEVIMGENDSLDLRFKQFFDDRILNEDMLNCRDVEDIKNMRFVGSGWTKSVYRGVHEGRDVAVKTVDLDGHDVGHCQKEGGNMTSCYRKAARKIIKEIVLLQALANDHVLKVLGFCVPAQNVGRPVDTAVAMVTELGEPIDQIKLLQMSWEDRLRVSYEVTKLINFLAQSPLGSVALNDFRRTQFVLVNGTLKLSDVDDAGFGEPQCTTDGECAFQDTTAPKCSNNHCLNHNELHNIYKTGQQFTTFLLPHGAPKLLRPLIDNIVQHFEQLSENTQGLLVEVEKLVELYKTGAYLGDLLQHRNKTVYEPHPQSDFPGQYDYRCRFSISGGACTISVFDLREAEEHCDLDEDCQGFVWTKKKTWTGRTIVHLKNGRTVSSDNPETDLYLKPA